MNLNFYIITPAIILSFLPLHIKSQCGSSPMNAGSSTTCSNFSSYTTYSGSSPCTGGGFGGGGSAKVIPVCTNSSGNLYLCGTGLPASGGVSIALYTGCTGNPPSLSGYVNNSAECYPDASSFSWSPQSQGITLSPNTCYYALIWSKNGFPAGSQICSSANPIEPNDFCTGAAPVGPTAQTFNNDCATAGSDGTYTEPPASQFCAGSLENNTWFSFTVDCNCTAPCTVNVTISNITCLGAGAGFQLGFWTGGCSNLNYLGCTSGSGGTVNATITGLNPCQQIIMGIDGNAGANCTFTITASNTMPLPISLFEFKGENIDSKNVIQWKTLTETNNDYFTLEKSLDGINYEFASLITGNGNSREMKAYEWIDESPGKEITFYRLKQTDYDGKSTHLGEISVKTKKLVENLEYYPNPFSGLININFDLHDIDQYLIFSLKDLTGKELVYFPYYAQNGNNKCTLNLSDLSPGLYILQMKGRNINEQFKLFKQ